MRLKKSDFKILKEKRVFHSLLFDVIRQTLRLPTSKIVDWFYIKRLDVVCAVPLIGKNEVLLLKEFRAAFKDVGLTICGGKTRAKTERERKLELNRELQEEIGYKAGKIEKLTSFYAGVHFDYKFHLYFASDLKKAKRTPEEGEIIEVVRMPIEKAWEEVLRCETTNPATIVGLALVKMSLGL